MKETTIDQTLVLCDLDSLLLDAAGNLPQLQRDVLQLFASRGGRLTVFSQRSPRAVRSLLGGVRLSAPALVCGGTLAYNFSEGSGTALCSFEGMEESVLKMLPSLSGVGIALQMRDGSTRAVRMSEGLVFHLKQEWTPFVLSNAADVKGEDVLRILFYQDKKQMPILPTLQKALGGRGSLPACGAPCTGYAGAYPGPCLRQCHAQRRLPSLRLCRRAADGAGRLHPDARPCPFGGGERCACGCRA